MKKRKQIVKVALTRLSHLRIAKKSEVQKCFPVLSKSHLHNYFADKMAVLSAIIDYILKKTKQSYHNHQELSNQFISLHSKLIKMRFDFLYNYHQLSFSSREVIKDEKERIKLLFEHIYQFERTMVSEILNTALLGEDFQRVNQTTLLLENRIKLQ